jgi:hypothetical protein
VSPRLPSFWLLVGPALLAVACVTPPEAAPLPPELHAPGADLRLLLAELGGAGLRGPGHEELDPLVGDWDVHLHALPSEDLLASGVARLEWTLGGLALLWRTELVIGERSAPALAFFTFDPRCSGLSSSASLARGRGSLDGVGIRLLAEDRDMATGQVRRARTVLRSFGEEGFELLQEVEEEGLQWRALTRTRYSRPTGAF